jgi:hypothetical protein
MRSPAVSSGWGFSGLNGDVSAWRLFVDGAMEPLLAVLFFVRFDIDPIGLFVDER